MLYLTGFIDEGKDYNRKTLSPNEMAVIFGVTEQLKKPILEFTHVDTKPDPLNGGLRHSRGYSVPSTFTAIYNGGQIEVTYSKSTAQRTEGTTTRTVNLPEEMLILQNREVDSFITANDKELALFWLLHPRNASSPIKAEGMMFFRTLDKEAEKKAKNNAIDLFDDLMMDIKEKCVKMPEVVIRKAKVLNVEGRMVSNVNWSLGTEEIIQQVRFGLRELAQINPFAFKTAWESPDLELKSIIGDCFDKGLLKEKTNGARTVVSFNGADILDFDHIEDKVVNVQIWVNGNYGERYKAIANALKEYAATQQTAAVLKKQK